MSAHWFETPGAETALHDHRFPLAVFPFAVDADIDAALYEMQWLDRDRGDEPVVVTVSHGACWGVARPQRVLHTVKTLRPHASIVLADVTEAPTRPDRLVSTPLPPQDIARLRERLYARLTWALGDGIAGPVGVELFGSVSDGRTD